MGLRLAAAAGFETFPIGPRSICWNTYEKGTNGRVRKTSGGGPFWDYPTGPELKRWEYIGEGKYKRHGGERHRHKTSGSGRFCDFPIGSGLKRWKYVVERMRKA